MHIYIPISKWSHILLVHLPFYQINVNGKSMESVCLMDSDGQGLKHYYNGNYGIGMQQDIMKGQVDTIVSTIKV